MQYRSAAVLCACVVVLASPLLSQAPATAQTDAAQSQAKSDTSNGFTALDLDVVPALSPIQSVVEDDEPERAKNLYQDYIRNGTDAADAVRREKRLSIDRSLPMWEINNKQRALSHPYLDIEVEIIGGERAPVYVGPGGYVNYTIRSVFGKDTVYGPPAEPTAEKPRRGYVSIIEPIIWRWDVPVSLQNCLAWDVRNRGKGNNKDTETKAIFFQPQKPLAETRTNPTLCYFGQKGLLWRNLVPIKEAVATLPEQDTRTYDVTMNRDKIVVSANGDYIWVIASAIGNVKDADSFPGGKRPEPTCHTFVFIYTGSGKLYKTLSLPNYTVYMEGADSLLDGNAVLLKMSPVQAPGVRGLFVFSTQGKPLYRVLELLPGIRLPDVQVSFNGRKIRIPNLKSGLDDKRYTHYFDLTDKDVALAKPQ